MIPLDKASRESVSGLFQGYKWNYLPDAILEGHTGEVLADNVGNPQVVVLEIPRLKLSIPGGDAGHPAARAYMETLPRFSSVILATAGWEDLLRQVHADKLIGMQRFAFTSENLALDHLRRLASRIPSGYQLLQMDLSLAKELVAEKGAFSTGHMVNFDSPEDFIARGFGFCMVEGQEIVSAATTFAVCSRGIEIQVTTREKHQGKGLATTVSAQLLVHSLENGLDPNWDAENEQSVGLAKKLGYSPQGTYYLWLVAGSKTVTRLVKMALRIKDFFQG